MTNQTQIQPYSIDTTDRAIDYLNDLHSSYLTDGWHCSVPLAYLDELVEYWSTAFDRRAQKAALNKYSQVIVTIDNPAVVVAITPSNPWGH